MGRKDDTMYDYLPRPKYFADIFNARCFGGRQVVRENELLEADGRSPMEGMPTRFRDIKKRLGNGMKFAILAVENQNEVDFEMPLRVMQYDCSEYQRQLRELHDRKAKARMDAGKKPNNLEAKMDGADRLMPTYTICLYHGKGSWARPLGLKDMMDSRDDDGAWVEMFADYPLILANVEDVGLAERCSTDMKQFLRALAARNDKQKMRELLKGEEFLHLEPETDRALTVMLDLDSPKYKNNADDAGKEGGAQKVCIAIDEMISDAREEGVEQGIEQGRQQGIEQGKQQGINSTLVSNIESVVQNFKVSLEEACRGLGTTIERYEQAKQLLQ